MAAILRQYGVEAKFVFPLITFGGTAFLVGATDGGTDCEVIKNEGASTNCTNDFAEEGRGYYSLILTATEMQHARGVITIVDAAGAAFEDQSIIIETYGHASAQHTILGVPVALDGGAATIAGMLTKMADDNAGADFDATTDSLNKIEASIVAGFPVNNTADVEPGGGTIVTGTNTANDGDSTFLDDGTYWQVAATTADGDGFGLSVIQTFTLGTAKRANLFGHRSEYASS